MSLPNVVKVIASPELLEMQSLVTLLFHNFMNQDVTFGFYFDKVNSIRCV
jgi:hypothetical protein